MKRNILQTLSFLVILTGSILIAATLFMVIKSYENLKPEIFFSVLFLSLVVNISISAALIISGIKYLKNNKEKEIKELLLSFSIILAFGLHQIEKITLKEWMGPITILIPIGMAIVAYKLLKKHLTKSTANKAVGVNFE